MIATLAKIVGKLFDFALGAAGMVLVVWSTHHLWAWAGGEPTGKIALAAYALQAMLGIRWTRTGLQEKG